MEVILFTSNTLIPHHMRQLENGKKRNKFTQNLANFAIPILIILQIPLSLKVKSALNKYKVLQYYVTLHLTRT